MRFHDAIRDSILMRVAGSSHHGLIRQQPFIDAALRFVGAEPQS